MKQLLLLLLLLPALAHAQIDPKYGEGAVPLADGKVVFTQTFSLPGQSQQQIFIKALDWANDRFTPRDGFQSRVLFSDATTGQIACLGQQYLVFADKALALDRATINYQMQMEAADGQCRAKISAIRYLYNSGGKNEIIPAEEQITDPYTLTKKKDKLIKATGKFRTHTIDLTEELFNGLATALGAAPAQPAAVEAPAPAVAKEPARVQPVTFAATYPIPGYKQVAPDKISNLIVENYPMAITAGNEYYTDLVTASWGGTATLFNRLVVFALAHSFRSSMTDAETYTLTFYPADYSKALLYCNEHRRDLKGSRLTPLATPSGATAFTEAVMIIECRKLAAQRFNAGPSYEPAQNTWQYRNPNEVFVGEVLNVWIKEKE